MSYGMGTRHTGDTDALDVLPGAWNDADWNFDDVNYDHGSLDWELWNALQDDHAAEAASREDVAAPSALLSHSFQPHHAPSLPAGANDDIIRESQAGRLHHPSRPTRSITSTVTPASRSPRPAYTQARSTAGGGSHNRRAQLAAQTSAIQDSISRHSRHLERLSSEIDTLHDRVERLSSAFPHQQVATEPETRYRRPTPHPDYDTSLTSSSLRNLSPSLGAPSTDYGNWDDAIDIGDILTDISSPASQPYSAMAPTTRRRGGGDVVDLTRDSDPASPSQADSPGASGSGRRKRSFQAFASTSEPSHKRRKPDVTAAGQSAPAGVAEEEVEQLDLTNEAPDAEEELTSAFIAQQNETGNESSGPQKIGQRQCIICMEPFTNMTITSCGHVYCHECLIQALMVGERNGDSGKGNCPVCRKPVNRKRPNHVIPLSFMTKAAFKGKARRNAAF